MKNFFLPLLFLFIFGCNQQKSGAQSEAKQSSAQAKYTQNVSLLIAVEKNQGDHAPNFTWYDETGKQVSFAEVTKGKPVVLNFWATWCGPCRKEMPDLVALNEEYKTKGAVVIGISADRDDDAVKVVSDFTKEFKVTYPIIIDDGRMEEAFGGLRGYPTTFYINKEGTIVKKLIGLQSKETFTTELNALL
ncbi:MAG: TlpA disulfide reductase family protein [Bacteroidota bacterium]|nr:TlpA disulfide reductase family protein [Bacteroidota bacterium]